MCAAVAGAIAAGVSAAATVAGGVVSATQGGGGGGGGAVSQQMLKGFPPATGMQSYVARTLALNADKRPPTFDEWVSSGGKARYDWEFPGFTPTEARQLRMVDEFGRPIPTYDPSNPTGEGTKLPGLSIEQVAYLGNLRRRRRFTEPHGEDFAITPEETVSRLYDRQQRLLALQGSGSLTPKQSRVLDRTEKRLQNVLSNPTKYTAGPAQEEKETFSIGEMLSGGANKNNPLEGNRPRPTGKMKRYRGY